MATSLSLSLALSLSLIRCLAGSSHAILNFPSLEGCGAAFAEGAAAAAVKTQEQHRFSGRLPGRTSEAGPSGRMRAQGGEF